MVVQWLILCYTGKLQIVNQSSISVQVLELLLYLMSIYLTFYSYNYNSFVGCIMFDLWNRISSENGATMPFMRVTVIFVV